MARPENGGLSAAEMEKYFGVQTGPKGKDGVPILESVPTREMPKTPERPSQQGPDRNVSSISRETQRNDRDALKNSLTILNNNIRNFLISGRTGVVDRIGIAKIRDAAESVISQKDKMKRENPNDQLDDLDGQLTQLADGLNQLGMGTFADNYIRPKSPPMRRAA